MRPKTKKPSKVLGLVRQWMLEQMPLVPPQGLEQVDVILEKRGLEQECGYASGNEIASSDCQRVIGFLKSLPRWQRIHIIQSITNFSTSDADVEYVLANRFNPSG